MPVKNRFSRTIHLALAAGLAGFSGAAAAVEFQIGENPVKFENLFTIGASWRMQDRDPTLISKSNLWRLNNPTGPGLCYTRNGDNRVDGPARDTAPQGMGGTIQLSPGVIPAGCSVGDVAANNAYIAAPGSYDPSGDNGNLNFDKGDIVHAIAKFTSDISFSLWDYNVFVRPIVFFDANYTSFETNYPNTTLQDRHQQLPDAAEDNVGTNLQFLDYNISHVFTIGEKDFSVKVGDQVLNWGESALLVFNSLNSINPLDATKVRMPGVDLKEFFQPLGMVLVGTDVMENVSVEGWYGYEFKPLIVDPPGTFFSQSDLLGPGGFYAQNGQGREPDDPDALFRGIDTCGYRGVPADCFTTPGTLGSTSSRIVRRNFAEENKRRTDDQGQYGVKLGMFLEDFNNGTELAFYYANYHSRYPLVSAIAATVRSCLDPTEFETPCTPSAGVDTGGPAQEPLPVDTISVFLEYPEDVQMYGTSFNTTVGDWALSGEVAYRPEQPTQIHSLDLSVAALGASFPRNDYPNSGAPALGQRASFPDFVSVYRGERNNAGQPGYENGEYIRGYEHLKTANISVTFLRLIGGDNPIGASQMTFLLELGMNRVFDMPSIYDLQFQGGGANTPISTGADDTPGINPRDVRTNPNDPSSSRYNNRTPEPRQNVTSHKDLKGFGTSESYGYRILYLNRWDSALFGANIETLTIVQHDVKGTSPGIGTNFLHGRKQLAQGLRFDYLSTWIGEVRYSWNTGGGLRDGLRDRDNIFVTLGYQF